MLFFRVSVAQKSLKKVSKGSKWQNSEFAKNAKTGEIARKTGEIARLKNTYFRY